MFLFVRMSASRSQTDVGFMKFRWVSVESVFVTRVSDAIAAIVTFTARQAGHSQVVRSAYLVVVTPNYRRRRFGCVSHVARQVYRAVLVDVQIRTTGYFRHGLCNRRELRTHVQRYVIRFDGFFFNFFINFSLSIVQRPGNNENAAKRFRVLSDTKVFYICDFCNLDFSSPRSAELRPKLTIENSTAGFVAFEELKLYP